MRARLSLVVALTFGHLVAAPPQTPGSAPYRFSIPPGEDSDLLASEWRYSPRDEPSNAGLDIDDTDWPLVNTRLLPDALPAQWNGIGWFRLRFAVASDLQQATLGMTLFLRGAAEVYLDGDPLYSLGEIGHSDADTIAFRQLMPYPFSLSGRGDHLLAVRFANHRWQRFHADSPFAGFVVQITRAPHQLILLRSRQVRDSASRGSFFGGVFLAFAALHLILFAFYPKAKENLYFAFFLGAVASNSYVAFLRDYTTDLYLQSLYLQAVQAVLAILIVVTGLLFIYRMFYDRMPRSAWLALLVGLALALSWLFRIGAGVVIILCLVAFCAEMLRVIVLAVYRRKEGARLIGTGFAAMAIALGYALLDDAEVVESLPGELEFAPYYSILLTLGCMSAFLSRRISSTSRNLEVQLARVSRLSEEKLEQERQLRDQQVEQQRLEDEYRHKLQELEEARRLQLSMLPESVPDLPGYEIAAYMQTATEVGGDYYDFEVSADGILTVAVGDATGHGMKAGTMVTAAKSLFGVVKDHEDVIEALKTSSKALKRMNLRRLYMALTLAKFEKGRLRLAAAGMPPALVHRHLSGETEQILLKGMPLGSFPDFPYRQAEVDLNPSDIVLFMTDGFAELFDADGEMLGYQRAADVFAQIDSRSAQGVIDQLVAKSRSWVGQGKPDDDMTFVAVKVRRM